MRGIDEETGEYRGASRTDQRRQALDVLALAHALTDADGGKLAKLPIPDDLRVHIAAAQRITSHIARKRAVAFLAKQMRREDDAVLDEIRDAMDAGGAAARIETALLHRAEGWRDRLIAEGDAALAELLAAYPDADRQQLRQLARNAVEERTRNKPPRSARELFKVLREHFAASRTASAAEEADADEAFDADATGDDGMPDDATR